MRRISAFILFSAFFGALHIGMSPAIAQSGQGAVTSTSLPVNNPLPIATEPPRLTVARALLPELLIAINQLDDRAAQPGLMARVAQIQLQLGQYDQAQRTIETTFNQMEQTNQVYYSHAFEDMVARLPLFKPWATTPPRQAALQSLLQQALKLSQRGELTWQLHGLNTVAVAAGKLNNPDLGQAAITAAHQVIATDLKAHPLPESNHIATINTVQLVITAETFKRPGQSAQLRRQQQQFMQFAKASLQPEERYYAYGASSLVEGDLAIGDQAQAKVQMRTAIQTTPSYYESRNFLNELIPIAQRFPDRPTADALVDEILKRSSSDAKLVQDVVASYIDRRDPIAAKRILAAHPASPADPLSDQADQAKYLAYFARSYRLVGDDATAKQHLRSAYEPIRRIATAQNRPNDGLYLVGQEAIQLQDSAIAQDCIKTLIARARPSKANHGDGDEYALGAATELMVQMPDRAQAAYAYRMMRVVLPTLESRIYPNRGAGILIPAVYNAHIHFNSPAIAQTEIRQAMQLSRQYSAGKLEDGALTDVLDSLRGEATSYKILIE
jgi:hypothetical protein